MKVSKKWLERYIDLSDLSMEQVADKLTQAGFEVEGIEPISSGDNLVIGQVLEVKDHPDSDHLHLTKVNIGDEVLNIVCGAPNVAEGQKVIVAKAGARLPGGVIQAGKIRGQESNGMICALFELGVDKHMLRQDQIDGIEILDEDAPIGNTDPLGYLGYDDVVLDISLTPNRAESQAINNLALELGAILDREVTLPEAFEIEDESDTNLIVTSDTPGCSIFLGKVIGSITIKESPRWMKELLRAAGMNSINNVVDISNIVMLETGQPMHFYDFEAIKDQEITVKDGYNVTYTALDDVDYPLIEEDLVITNQGRPIGIAGIMGGNDSKILDTTTSLIIECALFDAYHIRNTARRLGLATEASIRYQRGIEPLAGLKAMKRATWLLKKYADAKDIEKTVVFGDINIPEKTITFTLDQINNRLGTDFEQDEVVDVLRRLHLSPVVNEEEITVSVPSYRMDLENMADISEEVIRLIGYDRLPSTLPLMEMTEGKLNPMQKLVRFTRNYFLQAGLQDCVTYTLVSSEKVAEEYSSLKPVEINPPLSEERRWIRTAVLPSLLEAASYNASRSAKNISLFEVSEINDWDHYVWQLGIVLAGSLQESRHLGYAVKSDFYTIKGLIEEYLESLGIDARRVEWLENKEDDKHFHPYQSAIISVNRKKIGILGTIHPEYAKELGLKDVVMAQIDLSALLDLKKSKIRSPKISKYPATYRDLALLVPEDVKILDLSRRLEQKAKIDKEAVLKEVEIFDIYQGKGIEPGKKSVALSLHFQSDKQTLSDQKINALLETLLADLEKTYNATLRS